MSPPSGTKDFGATEGFMAPEIMRYDGEEEYNEKFSCHEGHEPVKEAVVEDNDALDHRLRPVYKYENRNTNKHPKKKMHKKRQEYKLSETEPIAQFDLASFIQSPDNIVERTGLYVDSARKRRLPSRDYSEYESIMNSNADDKLHDNWDEYIGKAQDNSADANEKDIPFKESNKYKDADKIKKVNSQHDQEYIYKNTYQDDTFERSLHHPQKKGTLNLRFPFFSRKKPDSLKSTKNKKRKTAAPKNSKIEKPKELITVNGQILNIDKEMLNNIDGPNNLKINKRSYSVKLCPRCKRKYIESLKSFPRIRRVSNNIIHNSRQFYQKAKEVEGFSNKYSSGSKKNLTVSPNIRHKRQQSNEDKERQMKELEEVERKIDSVVINPSATQKIKLFTANIKL
ncbi:unnamed protein product [Parnassius apollo]|uniref:(apollo) hypothetical protein n=1 Tax=Parnassius apollo TaxID=110799 RepID=A0A8S3W062_PARAO|nr:unnamed protein product [Parnassius apollo]